MTTGPPTLAAPTEALDDDPPLTEMMTTYLVGVTSTAPVSTALRLMAANGVRHLPVIRGRDCCGIVLEADLARFVAGGPGSPAHRAVRLVEELTRPTRPLPLTARRSDAARRMHAESSDAVLVINEDRLVGIVTATDVVRSLVGVRGEHASSGAP